MQEMCAFSCPLQSGCFVASYEHHSKAVTCLDVSCTGLCGPVLLCWHPSTNTVCLFCLLQISAGIFATGSNDGRVVVYSVEVGPSAVPVLVLPARWCSLKRQCSL